MSVSARFAAAMAGFDPGLAPLGLAVSGGGDSMALMHLAAGWADGRALHVATIDHGLRDASAAEAASVARAARALGLPHTVLHWTGWDGRGNLQQAARDARRHLLADWARDAGLGAIALGHTQDDQAETMLLRLARGSGVDGLAAMAPRTGAHGIQWLRPLLGHSRAELRDWLRARGLAWVDDPSNDNPDFDRIKARRILAELAPLGLSAARLARSAQHMQDARDVLERTANDAAEGVMRQDHGDIVFDAPALDALPRDTRDRLVTRALCAIASRPYRPRLRALHEALAVRKATLHGCLLTRKSGCLRITREAQAVARLRAPLHARWDQRWRVIPPPRPLPDGLEIGALGAQGLQHCPDRAEWCLPRASLLASPAIWDGTRLIAAPLAGMGKDWRAVLSGSPLVA